MSSPAASWQGGSGAIFNLLSDALRPASWTSADAAGLPIFAGLVRYEEILAGAIHHAIRFTVPQTQDAYVWPARHEASSLTGNQYPPMGARFRLKSSFNISGFSSHQSDHPHRLAALWHDAGRQRVVVVHLRGAGFALE